MSKGEKLLIIGIFTVVVSLVSLGFYVYSDARSLSTPPYASASTNTTDYLHISCSQLSTLINGYLNNMTFFYSGSGYASPNPDVGYLIQIYYGQGCASIQGTGA